MSQFIFTGKRGELDTDHCTVCGDDVGMLRKHVIVYQAKHGGLEMRVHCDHYPITDFEDALAIVSSTTCLLDFMRGWSESLSVCRHN